MYNLKNAAVLRSVQPGGAIPKDSDRSATSHSTPFYVLTTKQVQPVNDVFVKAYPYDKIVLYDSSFWRMRLYHKSTIPACYSLANVALGAEGSFD